jgi:hypothetical protein
VPGPLPQGGADLRPPCVVQADEEHPHLAAGALHPRLVGRAAAMEMHPPKCDLRVTFDRVVADDAPGTGHLHYRVLKQWESHAHKIRFRPMSAVTIR